MSSLRQALNGIGAPTKFPFHLREDFGRRTPLSLRAAIGGMADPGVASWSHLGIALARANTDTSDNVQGATTDHTFWYVVANGDDGLAPVIGVYDNAHQTVKKLHPTSTIHSTLVAAGDGTPHFGAPCFRNGRLHVPI